MSNELKSVFQISPIENGNGLELRTLCVGCASAITVEVQNVSRGLNNVQIHVETMSPRGTGVATAKPTPSGTWQAYVNGAYFPCAGESKYHVTARDSRGESVYLGCGKLNIVPSVLSVHDDVPIVPPSETYIRGTDGKYYPITIEIDEDQNPIPVIGEGVER